MTVEFWQAGSQSNRCVDVISFHTGLMLVTSVSVIVHVVYVFGTYWRLLVGTALCYSM